MMATSVIGNGSIVLDPPKTQFFSGESVTATAEAAPGWSFAGWGGDLSGMVNPQVLAVSSDKSISATFTQDVYTLTVDKTGQGTTDWEPKKPTYIYGDVVTLTATPEVGWAFMGWGGTINESAAETQITITGNTTATAQFEEITYYTFNTSTNGQGTVTKQPDKPEYQSGETVTLTATADPGWVFINWSGDLDTTTNPTQVMMDSNKSVTANFALAGPYSLSVDTEGSGYVNIDPEKDEYNGGDSVTLTPVPVAGWIFSHWKGDLTGSADPATVIMDENKAITAVFIQPIVSGPPTDNFDNCVVDSQWTFENPLGDGAASANGTQLVLAVPADVEHNVYTSGNDSARVVQATKNEDFTVEVKFDSHLEEDGTMQGIIVEQDDQNFMRFDFYKRSGNVTVYAAAFTNLVADYTNAKATIADVAPPTYLRVNRMGDSWELLYSFDGKTWTSAYTFDHVINVQKVGIFAGNFKVKSVIPAHTLVADYFYNVLDPTKPADQSLLTVNVDGNGQVQRTPAAPYQCGQSVTLTATPDTGAQFAGWSGDATGTTNPLLVVLDTRKTVTAAFTGGTTAYKVALPMVTKP
ncbi:MAG: DUF1349 domain-containing protein [Chloroflexota bacterium]